MLSITGLNHRELRVNHFAASHKIIYKIGSGH